MGKAGFKSSKGNVSALSAFTADNRLLRTDTSVTPFGIQPSNVQLDDSDNMTIPGSMTITGDSDAVQLLVKANATQTNWLINGQSSAGADMFYISGTGACLHKTSVDVDSAFAIFSSTNERLVTVRTSTPAASAFSVHAALVVTPGGGSLVGSSKTVLATDNSTIITSGTQSGPAFGSANLLRFTGSTILTSAGARALYNQVHWYSTATTGTLTGLENQFSYGSVSSPTGKVTTAYGLRGHVGQLPGSVGGSFGTFAHFSIRTPGADANNTIDNIYGFHMEDQVVTGVGASYGVFIEDQGAGGYAWKSGTGLNEFGDQVVIDTTQTEAFQVRQDADAQDVFTVDTTNKTTRVNNKLVIEGAGIAIPTTEYSITKSAHVPPRLTLNTAAASNIQLAIGGGAVHFFSAAAYQTNALLASASSLNNGQMGLGATGVPLFVARNLNDALTCFQIEQRHASATGDIVQFHNSTGSVADIDVNGRLTSVGATLGGTGIIDVTNAEALLIRQVGDTGNVFSVNTLVASTAATSVNTVDIATGAGAQAGSIYSIVGINLAAKIDSGTHSAPLFGMNILTQTSDTASKTGTFGNHQTGVNFISRHNSTGTNEEIYGVVGQTILGGPGSAVNIGAVTAAYGMRFSWEFQTSGTGSVTTAASIYIPTPGGTSGTKTVTNNYGLLLEDQNPTGTTNGYAIDIEDQSAGGYAIRTGTGLHKFGDTVETKKGRIVSTTRVTSTPYAVLSTDHHIFVDTDAATITATLPAGVAGTNYRIVNVGTSANTVSLVPNGAELLIGVNSAFTLNDGEALIITYEATEGWY